MNSQMIMSEMNAHFEKLLDKFYDNIQKEILDVVHKENQSLNKNVSYQELISQVSHIKAKVFGSEIPKNVELSKSKIESNEAKTNNSSVKPEQLVSMPRKELQALAKVHGIGGRSSNKELIRQLEEKLNEENNKEKKKIKEESKDKKKTKEKNEESKEKNEESKDKDKKEKESKKKDLEEVLEKSDEERKEIENSKFFCEEQDNSPESENDDNDDNSEVDELESFGSEHNENEDNDELIEEEYEDED